jgi:hypothetical protein
MVAVLKTKTDCCIYCGLIAGTREHIPSKQFFKGIQKKKLLVVPSCLTCNRSFQKDEDFFRQFWASMLMDRSAVAAELVNGPIMRSIQYKPKLGLQMLNQMRIIDLVTKSGIYLGKRTVFELSEFDRQRIDRVVNKIIKGLFYNQFKKVIPEDWTILINWITTKNEKDLALRDLAQNLRWETIKEDTFAYGFNFVPNTLQSVWILEFFKISLFYVLVLNKELAEVRS